MKTTAAVWCIALLGVAFRGWLTAVLYPWGGDPTFSYCYRALLIADGQWTGVFLMWHPPGMPLLIAAGLSLTGGAVSAYAIGCAISLLSAFLIIPLIDQLVRRRTSLAVPRIATAAFLAFYEGLAMFASGPLSEPAYLLCVYAALVLADARMPRLATWIGIGALLGSACLLRREGIVTAVSLSLLLIVESRTSDLDRPLFGMLRTGGGILIGALAVGGWILASPDYLAYLLSDRGGYTIPLANGALGNVVRVAECVYHACVEWLPIVLLAPFWPIATLGVVELAADETRNRLNRRLFAVVIPASIAVMLTLMHKRTGSFLLPAIAIWFGFGVEFLWKRANTTQGRWLIAGAIAILLLSQAMRPVLRLAKSGQKAPMPYWTQGGILQSHNLRGPVFAFGSEPEIYNRLQSPVLYPFRSLDRDYRPHYFAHERNPAAFVDSLRRAGFIALTFELSDAPASASLPTDFREHQTYSDYFGAPLRSDLELILSNPSSFHLALLRSETIPGPDSKRVYVFRIEPTP